MQVYYFPYIFLGDREEIDLGMVKVWNFRKKYAEYITDPKLRIYLGSILLSNIYHRDPISDMGIVSINQTDFREFGRKERELTEDIQASLFLSALFSNVPPLGSANAGWFMITSENFELVIQNFQPYSSNIAEKIGRIVTITTGGYKIGEQKFIAPRYVHKPHSIRYDERFLHYLFDLNQKEGKRLYRRIIRSADLFKQAYYNDQSVSDNARIMLIAAAFETLLNLPKRDQRKVFKELVSKYCDTTKDKKYSYKYEIRTGLVRDVASRKVIWADRFYTLRNHIIHGERIPDSEHYFRGAQHLYIATYFYLVLIKKLMNKLFRKKIFFDAVSWVNKTDHGETYRGFEYDNNELARIISEEYNKARKAKHGS